MENKNYAIHSLGLAKELIKRGFIVGETDLNKNQSERTVFLFEDTIEFRLALTEITVEFNRNMKKNKK
jgi:hypothetical protein